MSDRTGRSRTLKGFRRHQLSFRHSCESGKPAPASSQRLLLDPLPRGDGINPASQRRRHHYWICADAVLIFSTTFAGNGMYPMLSAIDWPVVTQYSTSFRIHSAFLASCFL
jgi:hypothetical protein